MREEQILDLFLREQRELSQGVELQPAVFRLAEASDHVAHGEIRLRQPVLQGKGRPVDFLF